MLLFNIFAAKTLGFFLLLLGSEGSSFGVYEVKTTLTPLGWATIVIIPTALVFGAIFLTVKFLKKSKLK